MDILEKIIARKLLRLEAAKQQFPEAIVRRNAEVARERKPGKEFSAALADPAKTHIIAEFKRCSPSKGMIRENADARVIAKLYASAGAAAISVLTEQDFFAGSLDDLRSVVGAVTVPILRKDFIVDEYQVYESAAAGASAVLLIVNALDDETLSRLLDLSEQLGMDALVEVHDEIEFKRALHSGAKLIGVNNRDLRTFSVSTDTSRALAPLAPADVVLVSESGLHPEDVRGLKILGYRGFLIGESLMRSPDPAIALREYLN